MGNGMGSFEGARRLRPQETAVVDDVLGRLPAAAAAVVYDAPQVVASRGLDDAVDVLAGAVARPQPDAEIRGERPARLVFLPVQRVHEDMGRKFSHIAARRIDQHRDFPLRNQRKRGFQILGADAGHTFHRLFPVIHRIGKRNLTPQCGRPRFFQNQHLVSDPVQPMGRRRAELAAAAHDHQMSHRRYLFLYIPIHSAS